jgi:glucosylceramidase
MQLCPYNEQGQKMTIKSWKTTGNQSALLRPQPLLAFAAATSNANPTITVDSTKTDQTMDGFGFTLSSGTAQLINALDPEPRDKLLRELFSNDDDAIGISALRLSIGASDMGERSFSYDDMPAGQTDPTLAHFDIMAGDRDVIPVMQDILKINPDITIIAAPWSAPAWMKTNDSFISGELKKACYEPYARYLVKYVQEMEKHGIPIHSITPQNEPLNATNEPSMVMTEKAQADFIGNHLGQAFQDSGLNTEIFCWDHNCDVPDYPTAIFDDPKAGAFTAGVAWHLYFGSIDALSQVHTKHPNKKTYFTEQWTGIKGNFKNDLSWHAENVITGAASQQTDHGMDFGNRPAVRTAHPARST